MEALDEQLDLGGAHDYERELETCPGSGKDRDDFCSNQGGTWLEPGGYSILSHIVTNFALFCPEK